VLQEEVEGLQAQISELVDDKAKGLEEHQGVVRGLRSKVADAQEEVSLLKSRVDQLEVREEEQHTTPRTYAEAASRLSPVAKSFTPRKKEVADVEMQDAGRAPTERGLKEGSKPGVAHRAIVVHGLPTHRRVGEMWHWLEKDNRRVKIAGARWLLKDRAGKLASSLVVYLRKPLQEGKLRMGSRFFRATACIWG